MITSLLLSAIPSLVEGGFLAIIIELMVSYHSRKIEDRLRLREDSIDERLDLIEKNQVAMQATFTLKIEQLQQDIVTLNDCKMTRPPRDYPPFGK
jgi:hypothetical protein